MYLSQETVKKKQYSAIPLMIVGGLFTLVGLYNIILCLVGGGDLLKSLPTYLVMVAMFASVFYLGVLNEKQIKLPRQMAAVFDGCQTDSITVRALSEQLNLPVDKTLEEVTFALNRSFLLHCRLDESGEEPTIILTAEEEPTEG